MILGVITCPLLSWLDVVMLSGRTGITAAKIFKSFSFGRKLFFPARGNCHVGPRRIVYVEDPETLLRIVPLLEENSKHYVVLLSCSPSLLTEYAIPITLVRPDADLLFRACLFSGAVSEDLFLSGILGKRSDLYEGVVASHKRESLIQKIQPMFYRVKDKTAREQLKKRVYRYLTGRTKRLKPVLIPALQQVLDSELTVTFRSCVEIYEQTLNEDLVESKGIDMFEINFVLRQLEK